MNLILDLDKGVTLAKLLEKIRENPVAVVVARNGEIVTEDYVLKEGDKVKIFSVVSGG